LGGKWKRRHPDRLDRLAKAIEAIGDRDRHVIAEADAVERLRARGAMELHGICREFTGRINAKLSAPALMLDPPDVTSDYFRVAAQNFLQINLRGRLLQFQFTSTDELYSSDDFRRPYVLRGTMRSFNQESLSHNCVDEQFLFYCPERPAGKNGRNRAEHESVEGEDASGARDGLWYFFDPRTHRSGTLGQDFLISVFERLL